MVPPPNSLGTPAATALLVSNTLKAAIDWGRWAGSG